MNLKELRKNNFSDKAIDFVNNYSEKLIAGDQDILNILLAEKIKIIHPKWNATSYIFVAKNYKKCYIVQKTFKTCLKNPSIVHFDGIKPWSSGSSHPYQKIFKKYLLSTEFKNFKFKFDLKKYIQNKIFFTGNRLAKLLPNSIYNLIETQYLKNNFIEKKYKQINENY
jgi:lipopolysaccharide biosynthesis glycosyltransferase